jgi:hypothetical protein
MICRSEAAALERVGMLHAKCSARPLEHVAAQAKAFRHVAGLEVVLS